MVPLAAAIVVFLISAGVAVYASDTGRARLLVVTKPLTTLLLFAVTGDARSHVARVIELGILLSLVGDVALLFRSKNAFLVGLVFFLGAHISYTVAFISAAGGLGAAGGWVSSPRVIVAAVVLAAATSLLVRALWRGAAGLRGPVVGYAAAISAMVLSAVAAAGAAASSAGGPSPGTLALVGALLFYVSDASLALDRFRRPIPHAALLTLGVYWLGQLGIALAARLATAG